MKILAVDLSAIFHQAWHVCAGEGPDAAYQSVVARVRGRARDYDRVAVCLDSPPYWRREVSADYKGTRSEKDAALVAQLARTVETLDADGFHILAAPTHEADDVIASLVEWARTGHEVTIFGVDKDLCQLVSDEHGVSVLHAQKGERIDEAAVLAKFGVPPSKVRDLLALMGDTSDNVRGVPGVGAKTASALLTEFGDLAGVFAAVEFDRLGTKRAKVAESIRAAGADVALAEKLVTLRRDVPCDFDALLAEKAPKARAAEVGWDADDDGQNDGWNEGEGEKVTNETNDATTTNETTPASEPPVSAEVVETPKPAATALARTAPTVEAPTAPAAILLPHDPRFAVALEPTDARAAFTIAKHLHDSRLFSAYGTPQAVFAAMMMGRSLGLDAMTALRGLHIIEGKPTISAQLMIALVMRSGKAEFFEPVETSPTKATWETKRIGGRRVQSATWTIEDAQRAGLVKPKGNWEKMPATMLRWRAASELARMVYPDVLANCYTPEELRDGAEVAA